MNNADNPSNGSDSMDTAVALTPQRRPRIFVRALIGIVLVIGMGGGYVAMGRQKAAKQAEAIDVVVQAGGRVYLDYQWQDGEPVPDAQPPEAKWLRRLVGDAMLDHAVAVDLRGVENPDAIARSLLLLPYLRHIDAADTSVSDTALSVWGRMPGLRGLDLRGTRVTDAGVEHLANLAQLITVSLARTAVSDKSIDALSRLHRLQSLDLTDTSVSSDVLNRLRRLLPRCQVSGT